MLCFRSHYTPKRGMKVRMALQVARVISYHGGEKTCPSVTGLDQGNRAAWERSPLGSKGGRFVTSESSASPVTESGLAALYAYRQTYPNGARMLSSGSWRWNAGFRVIGRAACCCRNHPHALRSRLKDRPILAVRDSR